MGRKSLLKSTKKKNTAKKSASEKTVKKKTAAKKKTTAAKKTKTVKQAATKAKKTAAKKATPKKKAPAKAKKTAAKKAAPAKKKKLTLKEILFKKFTLKGNKAKPVKVKKAAVRIPKAPPFVSGKNKKETAKIQALLFKSFDLSATETSVTAKKTTPAKKATPAKKSPPKKKTTAKAQKAPAKKKKMTKKEILFQQFQLKNKQPKPVKVAKKAVKIPAAPPFVNSSSKKETERIRQLLFQQFDLTAVASAPKKPAAKKKAVSMKDILFKKFKGAAIKPVKVKKASVTISDAPPFVTGESKALLFKQFDLASSAPAEKKTPAPKAAKKAAVGNILFRQFEGMAAAPVVIKKTTVPIPDAPPIISGYSKEESEKIRALLFKQFEAGQAKGAAIGKATPAPAAPTYEPASADAPEECVAKGKKLAMWVLVALVALLIGSSYSNRGNYFLKDVDGVVQVWQGKFAPLGEEMILTLDGATMPENVQSIYTKKEISPIVFDHMMGKADFLLDAPQGPDFGAIKKYLRQAKDFAPTPMLQTRVQNRIRGIDFVVLFHRADIAIAKGTQPDLMAAKAYLQRARSTAFTAYQRDMVTRAAAVVDESMAALEK